MYKTLSQNKKEKIINCILDSACLCATKVNAALFTELYNLRSSTTQPKLLILKEQQPSASQRHRAPCLSCWVRRVWDTVEANAVGSMRIHGHATWNPGSPSAVQSLGVSSSTSNEAQPLGQDVRSLGLDEDLAAIQCHTGAQFPAHIKHGWFLGERKTYDQVAPAEPTR